MDDTPVCRTEQEIRDKDLTIKELEDYIKERSQNSNGEKHIDILSARVLIQSRITGLQTKDDVEWIRGEMEEIKRERIAYPSILQQLVKIPLMGWPLLLATILFFWILARIPEDILITLLHNAGYKVSSDTVVAGVSVIAVGLVFSSYIAYNRHIEKELKKQ